MLAMIRAKDYLVEVMQMVVSAPVRVSRFVIDNKHCDKCGYDRPVYLGNKTYLRVLNTMYSNPSGDTFWLILGETPKNVSNG